jgi:hypothetical protein
MKKKLRSLMPFMLLILGVLSLLTVCPGCATMSEPIPKIVVKAQSENQFLVNERIVDLNQLPKALKQAGADYETEIIVEMPAGASPSSMRLVYPTLQSAGFQKVFLAHPREATSSVKSLTPVTATPVQTMPPARSLSPAGPKRVK